jgi:hypothetical protein
MHMTGIAEEMNLVGKRTVHSRNAGGMMVAISMIPGSKKEVTKWLQGMTGVRL